MGAYGGAVQPLRGSPADIADANSRCLPHAGADHVQLVVDPITRDSIEWFQAMFAVLDGVYGYASRS